MIFWSIVYIILWASFGFQELRSLGNISNFKTHEWVNLNATDDALKDDYERVPSPFLSNSTGELTEELTFISVKQEFYKPNGDGGWDYCDCQCVLDNGAYTR